jgi:hypothetical protein
MNGVVLLVPGPEPLVFFDDPDVHHRAAGFGGGGTRVRQQTLPDAAVTEGRKNGQVVQLAFTVFQETRQ